MIFDLDDQLKINKKYDFIIIGGGVAGITCAITLGKKKFTVLLLEAGGLEFSENSQKFYKGEIIGDQYIDLDQTRLRFLGGSSNHWGGKCRPFEKYDLDNPIIGKINKWPIKIEEIDKYLNDACEILEIKNQFEDNISISDIRSITFQYSKPVNFKDKYFKILKESNYIDLILNANFTDINGEDGIVKNVECTNYRNYKANFEGKKIILATGGIENSRILLFIEKKYKNKFFKSNLPLGKYWMEHPHFDIGRAFIKKDLISNHFALSQDLKLKLKILGCSFKFDQLNSEKNFDLLAELAFYAPKVHSIINRLIKKNIYTGVNVKFASEQYPSEKNKIELSNTLDEFKIPTTILKWKKREIDYKTIELSSIYLSQFFAKNEIARIKIYSNIIKNRDYPDYDQLGGNHHLGGTRMHESSQYGVVDRNLKIFGSKNFYVIGSSVFTSGGYNNPTLPVVQLSLRLCEHLSKEV